MPIRIVSILTAALSGAVLAAAGILVTYTVHPSLTMDMDRPPPSVVSGLYGEERADRETFAWTRGAVTLTLDGIDRSIPWICGIRLKGGRADVTTLPEVTVTVDGIVVERVETTNDYADVTLTLPIQSGKADAVLGLTVSNTFVPEADQRSLGVIVDRWSCAPEAGRWARAPLAAIWAGVISGAAFGAAMAVVGGPVLAWGGLLLTLVTLQAVPLTWDFGAFGAYPAEASRLALGFAAAMVLLTAVATRLLKRPLSPTARWVGGALIVVCYLKVLALAHPSKPIVDAVFHAHRLQWILEGRWFFTQPMPSGVRFPYAIGLYVFSAPLTLLTSDFVWLLRMVVVTAEATGGVLLYAMIVRYWNDRPLGAAAAVLMAVVPRTFEIVGNANMTNAFGQSAALAVLAAATLWNLEWGRWRPWIAFTLLTAAALLCHISTFTLLSAILASLTVAYWFVGDRSLRTQAVSIGAALGVAAVLAVILYYGHFGEAYASASRVQAATGPDALATVAPFSRKLQDALSLTVAGVGWPLFIPALAGGALLLHRRRRDRLTLALLALATTFVVFAVGVVLAPVEQSFQRYSAEFFSRVTLATYPAMVVGAAVGLTTAWRRGAMWRLASIVAGTAALAVGVREWIQWLR